MIDWAPRVLASGLGFPEGPVVLDDGDIVFTEIRGQCVSRVRNGSYEVVARTGGGANGATLGADGAVYVANNGGLNVGPHGYWHAPDPIQGRVQRVTLDGEITDVAVGLPAEIPHRPNDLCFGPDGMLYVTDPANWEDLANLMPGRIWRVDPASGEVEQVAEVPHFVNGIAFSPDGTLYAAQSIAMTILEFPWKEGLLGEPRAHATLPTGFPDGMCVTADGGLIVCGSMGDVIQVFDDAGALKQTIETGKGTEPTNCCLEPGKLYVTLSGVGELVAVEVDLEPLLLHPFP